MIMASVSSLVQNSFPVYGLIAQGWRLVPVKMVIDVEKERWLAFEDTRCTRYASVYEQLIPVTPGIFITVENAIKCNYLSPRQGQASKSRHRRASTIVPDVNLKCARGCKLDDRRNISVCRNQGLFSK